MTRGIKLVRSAVVDANYWYLKVWRLRIDVAAVSGGMDPYVFLFARGDPDPNSGEVVDTFETVCTVADMSYWPVGDPDPEAENPYYRSDFVELDFKSQQEFDQAWEIISKAVNDLRCALDLADALEVTESVWYSEPCA